MAPKPHPAAELLAQAKATGDPDLVRLALEYRPGHPRPKRESFFFLRLGREVRRGERGRLRGWVASGWVWIQQATHALEKEKGFCVAGQAAVKCCPKSSELTSFGETQQGRARSFPASPSSRGGKGALPPPHHVQPAPWGPQPAVEHVLHLPEGRGGQQGAGVPGCADRSSPHPEVTRT